ncbi:MAG: hypothetical protein QNJ98_12510 [Planctomycetota bacterium]|nr:hypothetical protein [Planctomycetota bacterium]
MATAATVLSIGDVARQVVTSTRTSTRSRSSVGAENSYVERVRVLVRVAFFTSTPSSERRSRAS